MNLTLNFATIKYRDDYTPLLFGQNRRVVCLQMMSLSFGHNLTQEVPTKLKSWCVGNYSSASKVVYNTSIQCNDVVSPK